MPETDAVLKSFHMKKANLAVVSGRDWWNAKASPCSKYERLSAYAEEFLKLADIRPGETVFDMGCGSGTLCLPLADRGHRVFCADFAENMLNSVRDTIEEEHLTCLTLCLLAWEDDWSAYDLPVCDVAVASRSLFNMDPEEAVTKLSSVAKRRVCLSLPICAGMFSGPDSPYQLGSQEDMRSCLNRCAEQVKRLGFEPKIEYMKDDRGGEPHWAFLSFDK